MFEDMDDLLNDSIINMYDAKHYNDSVVANDFDGFDANQMLLADCYLRGKSWWCSWNSDARLKENITDFNYNSPEWIENIKLKKFNYIGQNKEIIGVIAQELREILPNSTNVGENGYLNIDLSQILFMTVATVKKLNSDINVLQAENVQLKAKLNEIINKEK